jgi:hypothetical protein
VNRLEALNHAGTLGDDPAVIAAGESLSNPELDALIDHWQALNNDPGAEPSAEASAAWEKFERRLREMRDEAQPR